MMFVMVRTADAHAHFCFDGKEPPTSIHVSDGEVHPCETDASKEHKGDQDVKLSPDLLAKNPQPTDVWVPYVFAFVLQFSANPYSEPVLGPAQTDAVRPALFHVPPLRGPPV